MVSVILLPRALPQVAANRVTLPGYIETEVALHRDLKRIGNAHNPDDPYFNDFKARTLARYGVKTVEELPVHYGGLVGMEGERLTTELYAKAGARTAALEQAQNGFVRAFALVSPMIAISELSMALAGSDIASHHRFLDAAEAFRYRFVQTLNRMQVDLIPNVNAGTDPRISAANWQRVPSFQYRPADPVAAGSAIIWSSLAVLIGWMGLLATLFVLVSRKLGRTGS
jgi:ABC-2 type transport system permease protein